MGIILKTSRLTLREITWQDRKAIAAILQDPEVMVAYEHAFSNQEVDEWINRQMKRYETDGFGLWAVIDTKSKKLIGQCGITMQPLHDKEVLEIGYLFNRQYWHEGYATEAALACRTYGFQKLNAGELYSIIRDNNLSSRAVAERNGMKIRARMIKHYYHRDMPHLVYSITRQEANICE